MPTVVKGAEQEQRRGTRIQLHRLTVIVLNYFTAKGTVLVCQNCWNKVPKNWSLKPENLLLNRSGGQKSEIKVLTGPCSLSDLQGRTLPCLFQLLVLTGLVPSQALRENLFYAFSQLVVTAKNPWCSLACRCIIPICTSVFIWHYSSCVSSQQLPSVHVCVQICFFI